LQAIAIAIRHAGRAPDLQSLHGANALAHRGEGRPRIAGAGVDEEPPGTASQATQGRQPRLPRRPLPYAAEANGMDGHRPLRHLHLDLLRRHAAGGVIAAIAQDHQGAPRGQVGTLLPPQGQALGQGLMEGGAVVRGLQAVEGGGQGRPVRRRRHQGADLIAKGQDGRPVRVLQGGDPIPQRLADALELGRVQGARQIDQQDVKHPFARRGEGRGRGHLRHLGAQGRARLAQGLRRHRRAGFVAHRHIGRDLGPPRQRLGNLEARRRLRPGRRP
jgi:hypothetical protein